MAKLSTKKSSRTHRCIIYGAPKSGKSQLAGELAEFYNLKWVDMENGHEVLFKLPEEWQERIELINLPDTRDYPIAVETCLKMVRGPVSICEAHGKVDCHLCNRELTDESKDKTDEQKQQLKESKFTAIDLNALTAEDVVVFDSLTQFTNSAIAHITQKEDDYYKLKQDDWGNLGKILDIFLSALQQAHYNVIVISHETEAETEGKKKTLVPVGGTRNTSRNVAKYFDHVIYAERKNMKHVFASSTQYSNTILSGSRTDVVMEGADKPSLLAIFKPELYADRTAKEATVAKPQQTTAAAASSRLQALLNKQKS